MKRNVSIILTVAILVLISAIISSLTGKTTYEVGVAMLMGIISVFIVDRLDID